MSAHTDVSADPVLVERRGHTVVVTLNRPEARNAVNMALAAAAGDAFDAAENDPDVRVIVITGSGTAAFSAGADLKAIGRGEPILPPGREAWGLAGFSRRVFSKPTIAAVNGVALGGGMEIALAADFIVAADTARFGLPEVKRGLIAAAGGAFRILDQVPRKVGLEMLLTGEPIDAPRALELNLVNRVVPGDRLLDEALALAEKVAANAPLAVQASKRIALGIRDGVPDGDEKRWQLSAEETARNSASADAKEGVLAFAEKRPPVWQGR
ncbi:enoyl-CoA hydratase [Aeromicrobium yanjiei]|uniref:enoyl-CoA hydratase n=1 Tax=Aeromicrobium yanjiei TaxID=2662028 RepID=A0A5Q2MKG6_9ACTN|nr:enoyl-CoA hydratase [Aeromicrobium yanjiei]